MLLPGPINSIFISKLVNEQNAQLLLFLFFNLQSLFLFGDVLSQRTVHFTFQIIIITSYFILF
jgi:hypothetical protein